MKGWPLAVVVLVVVNCGGLVGSKPDGTSGRGPWEGLPAKTSIDPLAGDVMAIPGGSARMGDWQFDASSRRFVPEACNPGHGLRGSMRVTVGGFRMMRLEVSVDQYAACVRRGQCEPPRADLSLSPSGATRWDDPRRLSKPVAATYAQAREFCLALGGDLPTYLEWIRAAEGDDGEFGIAKLTRAFIRCVYDANVQQDPSCIVFYGPGRRFMPDTPVSERRYELPDVGSTGWDVGPFGHQDLFGSAVEWVRQGTQKQAINCAADGSSEGDVFGPPWNVAPAGGAPQMQIALPLWGTLPIGALEGSNSYGPDPTGIPISYGLGSRADRADMFSGFRCAFPADSAD